MTISIMSMISKIILKEVNERQKKKVEETINSVQFGFRKGLGARYETFMLRTVMKMAIKNLKDLYMCFVNYEKAFNTVTYDRIMEKITSLGVFTNLDWKHQLKMTGEFARAAFSNNNHRA